MEGLADILARVQEATADAKQAKARSRALCETAQILIEASKARLEVAGHHSRT
jgi:hypothetical protein